MDQKEIELNGKKLSPVDLKGFEFKKNFRGYDPKEVDDLLDAIAKAWDRALKEEKSLQKKIGALTEELGRWKARETELTQIREKAVADAEEIRNQASREAARILQEVDDRAKTIRNGTEQWLEDVLSRLEETQRQRSNFLTALRSSLDSHYELLKTEATESSPLGAQLTEFLQARLSTSARTH